MTHKIKVQMFGNFRMDYNGAPFVAEKMHKESQFNRMMQALIHYSDCGIAKDKLEEIVIGERDIDAPHTALRVIVYKTKQKLAQLGLPGKNLVYLEGGIYYWTPDIEIEEDAAEFEKLYNEACALEKQMPHEPESAETVCDERIKEIEDNMLELYIKALYLYKGELGYRPEMVAMIVALVLALIEAASVYFVVTMSGLFIGIGLIVILFVNIIVTIKRISEIEYKRQKEESDKLRNQTERVSLQMMKTLAATIEAKDDYMRGH